MSENIFFTKFSELSGNRFDASYYIPELIELEKKVTNISRKRLKDFVLSISSGATPKTTEQSKYYTEDEKEGIPFLRVQNLSEEGNLNINNIKYINEKTHEGMLQRSQVEENDLLIKITGVGRMAIASVPEIGFKGNTNQHMVVVKTKDRITSQTLATYLNLDIAEKLASRRATGGTRPALDYPALLSMPIIYDENILPKLQESYKLKAQKEKEAQDKLDSIDNLLLNELGINILLGKKDTLEDKIFFRKFNDISGDRLDPSFHKTEFKNLLTSIKQHNYTPLKSIVRFSSETWNQKSDFIDKFPYIEISEIDIVTGAIDNVNYVEINKAPSRAKMIVRNNDIIVSTTRPNRGAISLVETESMLIASTGFSVIRDVNKSIKKEFLFILLKSSLVLNQFHQRSSGGNYPAITQEEIAKVIIPFPTINIQNKIIAYIKTIKKEAQVLKDEANKIYEDSKREVEKMILGDNL